jgi:hypothetical protein
MSRIQGAVASNGGADVEFLRTRFERNQLGSLDLREATHVLIDGCDFLDHHDTLPNVVLTLCADVTVRGSHFLRNTMTTSRGGGAALLQGWSALIEFCTFAYDSAFSSSGGALNLAYAGTYTLRNNTFDRCFALYYGAAVAEGPVDLDFERNIVANCQGLSGVSNFGGTLTTGCDVYWANQDQNFYVWTPAPTDIMADPQFCDAPALDFRVNASSPCLPGNGNPACAELIGALGEGCGVVSVSPWSWGRLKGVYRTEAGDGHIADDGTRGR